jgi:hypothetical protein
MAKVGRPPHYETVEQLQEKITEYFANCPDKRTVMVWKAVWKEKRQEQEEIPCPTITWLALHLWFADRRSLYEYEDKQEFTHTIKVARTFMEREYEKLLHTNPTWAIFALKNFWRSDKHEVESTSKVTLDITKASDDELLQLISKWSNS